MQFEQLLQRLVSEPEIHARWLNTLSLMENTGARKISASESKTGVTLIVLKHAAEEARHAYYLKKQIAKLDPDACPDYSPQALVAPRDSAGYLHRLDVEICRYLKNELGLRGEKLKYGAYLLVTYAIEVRADELYPAYQEVLTAAGSRVTVKSIILEEETHLAEMLVQMQEFFGEAWETHATAATQSEARLYTQWLQALERELGE